MNAPPDGHTLLSGIFSLAVAPSLMKLPYDTTHDLVAVSQVASTPLCSTSRDHNEYSLCTAVTG